MSEECCCMTLRAIDHKSDSRPAQPISPNFLFFCWLIGLMEGVNGCTNFWGSGARGGCGGGGLLFSSWRGEFWKIAVLAVERGLMANLVHGVGLGTCHM